MVTEKFISILKNPEIIQQEETQALKKIVKRYPYFQSARGLYLKALKNQDSFKYNNELKITAAHTTDRTVLFDFITSTSFNTIQKAVLPQNEKTLLMDPPVLSVEPITPEKELLKEPEQELSLGKPLSFSSSEKHSFSEWLQLSSAKPIERTPKKEVAPVSKTSIINRFIEKNPKIVPVEKDKNMTVLVSKNEPSNSLMTETLAKVYLEQKKYENAIQAYKILSLKYPEKSGFFADQIKRIQTLQKNKS